MLIESHHDRAPSAVCTYALGHRRRHLHSARIQRPTVWHGRYLLFEWSAARAQSARAFSYAVRRGGPATFSRAASSPGTSAPAHAIFCARAAASRESAPRVEKQQSPLNRSRDRHVKIATYRMLSVIRTAFPNTRGGPRVMQLQRRRPVRPSACEALFRPEPKPSLCEKLCRLALDGGSLWTGSARRLLASSRSSPNTSLRTAPTRSTAFSTTQTPYSSAQSCSPASLARWASTANSVFPSRRILRTSFSSFFSAAFSIAWARSSRAS